MAALILAIPYSLLWVFPLSGTVFCLVLGCFFIFYKGALCKVPGIRLDLLYLGPTIGGACFVFCMAMFCTIFMALFEWAEGDISLFAIADAVKSKQFYLLLDKAVCFSVVSLGCLYFCWGSALYRDRGDVIQRARAIEGSRARWSMARLFGFGIISSVFLFLLNRGVGYILFDLLGFESGLPFAADDLMIVVFSVLGYFFLWFFLFLNMLGLVFGFLARMSEKRGG